MSLGGFDFSVGTPLTVAVAPLILVSRTGESCFELAFLLKYFFFIEGPDFLRG